MFTKKERLYLIMTYGLEEAVEFYNRYQEEIKQINLSKIKPSLSIPVELPNKLYQAILFIEYQYEQRGNHYEEISDFFNTLRAIERQVI
ncbi:hypothetical protein [Macrococcoides caseolyticum]|uniref:hypothetical protein n=1 Tax=Macrococcoides caseolyticum TaxID=69966 RepID=UPI001F36E496|nr:hypothetical protein [Macrococcus caseolyticus]MCE4957558.1 hypothetical protein [Macrococcus caseolyticus]